MNERILELAEQAGLKVESWMTNPPKPFQILGGTEEFEKFAGLIVKECIEQCTANDSNDEWDKGVRWAANQIKEHFKVDI